MKKWCVIIFISLASIHNVIGSISINDTLSTYSSVDEGVQKAKKLIELSEEIRAMDPQKAAEYGLEAIRISKEITNSELQQMAEFTAGFAFYIQNDFEKALHHLDNSLEISRNIENKPGEAASLNRIGNTFQLMGEYGKALDYYNMAMTINKELEDDQEIARTLTNLGSVYRLHGNYELAINQHLKALGIYEGLKNNEGIAWSALNIARLFKMMKNYPKSLDYVNQSLEIYQNIEDKQDLSIGVTLCLKEFASIYYEMGNLNFAVVYGERVLERNRRTNNMLGVANSLSTLGKIYFDVKNYDQSEQYLIQAKNLKDSLNDNTENAAILRYLGKIHLNRGETLKAKNYFNNSLDFAKNQNLKQEIKEAYLDLSKLYENTHNSDQALRYYKKYIALKDSLNNQKINELALQYEFDKEQRKREFEEMQKDIRQEAKLQREKIFKWAFASGFLLMLVLAFVIFNSYQRKKKTNILLTKQKNEIAEQKDEIEAQRDFVTKQRDQIAHQNTIITDSIEYAKRIQSALFPQKKFLDRVLGEYFIYMKPKNIVSGDFYWVAEKGNKLIITVSDCTGHGVPGAFMSMLGIAFLNEIVNKNKILKAGKILDQLRENIIDSLHQEYGVKGSKDGMDMALCILDKKTLEMQFAGAYNSAFVIRGNEFNELKADKMPIGIHAIKVDKPFSNQEFKLEKQDMLYLFSDGYADQFGGEKGMKFKQSAFKELLSQIAGLSVTEQQEKIASKMLEWQGDFSQLDDMMIMGIRI
ncbi:MAG: tetratricopeptide repeat protein [Bacteroidetes bacterium]|nr:tetratricopeptide repeat protein [Bacteroidota bacterium]